MEEVLARGPNFVYGREFVRDEHGQGVWEQVLDTMPADAAAIWSGKLLITGSYPFPAFKKMLAALEDDVEVTVAPLSDSFLRSSSRPARMVEDRWSQSGSPPAQVAG